MECDENEVEKKRKEEEEKKEEYQPPKYLAHQLKVEQRPESVNLTLPTKGLASALAKTAITIHLSARQEKDLMLTLCEEGGADPKLLNHSVSTIVRERHNTITSDAQIIRENFIPAEHNVLHWDSKLIQLLSGVTEDRVAVVISSPDIDELNQGKFLASPIIPSSSGQNQADVLVLVLQRYGVGWRSLFGFIVDTTANNLGKHNGSAIILESIIGEPVFYLPCRHHIAELHIHHASIAIRGPTKGMRFHDKHCFLLPIFVYQNLIKFSIYSCR